MPHYCTPRRRRARTTAVMSDDEMIDLNEQVDDAGMEEDALDEHEKVATIAAATERAARSPSRDSDDRRPASPSPPRRRSPARERSPVTREVGVLERS
jgi:hypothetical protein|tara:strand:- start:1887 stop:2180 length:294 start_codon:yes stop_codon:yes gene_type:complete